MSIACDQKAGFCPKYWGENGYCCSGENPVDPGSHLAESGLGNGDCPVGAIIALMNRPEGVFRGFMCVKEVIPETQDSITLQTTATKSTTPATTTNNFCLIMIIVFIVLS